MVSACLSGECGSTFPGPDPHPPKAGPGKFLQSCGGGHMRKVFDEFLRDEHGAAIEYALLSATVSTLVTFCIVSFKQGHLDHLSKLAHVAVSQCQ